MKSFALAGFSDEERNEFARLTARAGTRLDEEWSLHDGDGRADLVVIDPEQFGGRVARVRAVNERTNFAVVVDADAESPEAFLVLRRPLTTDAIIEMFNRAAPAPDRKPEVAANDAPADAEAAPVVVDARACFQNPRAPRIVTDVNALLTRGPVAIERPGLARLVIDPARGCFHASAPLSRLESYFLDPLKPGECRQMPQARMEDIRRSIAAQPIVQLHWVAALMRSNGCLGPHLDPGGTFRVQRWMSVYGEYRKQYRIATMMLRPARLHEIARKAEATMTEVFDVVNAYDAIGLLQWERRQPRQDAKPARTTPASGTARLLAAALLTK